MTTGGGPLRAGFVIDALAEGAGTENQLRFVLERLDRDRVRPHLVCLHASPGFDAGALPCPVEVLGVRRLASATGMRALARYRRRIREWRLDVVQTFFRDANLVGTVGAVGRVPVVSSRRNLGAGYWHNRLELALLRMLRPATRLWAANARAVADYTARAEGVPRDRIRVVPNAVDTERFRPPLPGERDAIRAELGLGDADRVLVCVANLRPVKGVDRVVKAFLELQAGDARLQLLLVGEGTEEGALRRLAAPAGERVRFLGGRGDVERVLRAADGFVLGSRGEGQSNAVLEAQASGVPVVATAVGGTPELLDADRGIAVDPEEPDALAAGMAALFADPARAASLRANALHEVRRSHTPAAVLDQWVRVLEEAAGRRGPQ